MRSGKKHKGPLQCDYITCQMDMDFGVAHNEAMDKCLRKYHFKSLPCVNPEANKWQRKHAMDCIVWVHNIIGDSPSSQATTMLAVQESSMPEEELHNILKVSLIDEEVDKTAQAGCSREQSGFHLTQTSLESDTDADSTEDDSGEGEIQMLHHKFAEAKEESMRQRQIKLLLTKLEPDKKVQKRF